MPDEQLNSDWIAINHFIRDHLVNEIKRTGVSPLRLLSDDRYRPDGLSPNMVDRWIDGTIKAAPDSHIGYVEAKWAALADNAAQTSEDGAFFVKNREGHLWGSEGWVRVGRGLSASLRAELSRTGLNSVTVLKLVTNKPPMLRSRAIREWLYQDEAVAHRESLSCLVAHLVIA